MTPQDAGSDAIRLLNGFRGYQLVVAACRLKLPDLGAAGHHDAGTLAAETGTHEASLRRALRGLAAWGFFAEDSRGCYTATALSDLFRSDQPGLRNITLMLSEEGYRVWEDLVYTLRTGQPAFEHVFGKNRWTKLAEEPEHAAQFNAAMVEATRRVVSAFVKAYDFGRVRSLVDVGGGNGALLAGVLAANPELEGVLFDLAAGLAGAAEAMESAGLAARVRIVEGSFFESVPRGADLYLLKSIIHDWDDDHAVSILKTCRAAMSRGSRLLLLERLVPDRVTTDTGSLATLMGDLHMMVLLGGRERTTAEYASLFESAGLRPTHTSTMDSRFHAIRTIPARA